MYGQQDQFKFLEECKTELKALVVDGKKKIVCVTQCVPMSLFRCSCRGHTRTHSRGRLYMHTFIRVWMHTYMRTCVCTRAHIHIYTCVFTHKPQHIFHATATRAYREAQVHRGHPRRPRDLPKHCSLAHFWREQGQAYPQSLRQRGKLSSQAESTQRKDQKR